MKPDGFHSNSAATFVRRFLRSGGHNPASEAERLLWIAEILTPRKIGGTSRPHPVHQGLFRKLRWYLSGMTPKSQKRIALANRVIELSNGSTAPISFKELAQLRNLAETPEERSLPLEEIAARVIQRENANKQVKS